MYSYPRTCLEIKKRGLKNQIEIRNGIYKIQPTKGKIVEKYCDFERHGGGWTLVLKSASNTEWTKENAGDMNSSDASKNEYFIFQMINHLKLLDVAEVLAFDLPHHKCSSKNKSSHQRCSLKRLFLKILQSSQENTCTRPQFVTL